MRAGRAFVAAIATLAAIAATPASAQIDMSGRWNVTVSLNVGEPIQTIWEVTQVGSALTVVNGSTTYAGTLDTTTGAFAIEQVYEAGPLCLSSAEGVVAPDGYTFAGPFTLGFVFRGCTHLTGTASGTRCRNGVVEPGEECGEDGTAPNGCCSLETCRFEPADVPCGGECSPTVCDGAGQCVPGPSTDGQPCDDGQFCNGADFCGLGMCIGHDGDPCAGQGPCTICAEASDACVPTPAGWPCSAEGSDGNVCTSDVCNAAGQCEHPPAPSGGACPDDGNVCTDDRCDGAGACAHPPAPATRPCADDGLGCTVDRCDGAGQCIHPLQVPGGGCTPSSTCRGRCDGVSPHCPGFLPAGSPDGNCPFCQACDGAGGCDTRPLTGCRTSVVSRGGQLRIRNFPDDTHDQLVWRWRRGEATTYGELEIDATHTGTVCAYATDGAPGGDMLLVEALLSGDLGWTKTPRRLVYESPIAFPGGISRLTLTPGTNGRAKIALAAKGPHLPLGPTTPLAPPIVVQYANESGQCWQSTFSDPSRNDGMRVNARAD